MIIYLQDKPLNYLYQSLLPDLVRPSQGLPHPVERAHALHERPPDRDRPPGQDDRLDPQDQEGQLRGQRGVRLSGEIFHRLGLILDTYSLITESSFCRIKVFHLYHSHSMRTEDWLICCHAG